MVGVTIWASGGYSTTTVASGVYTLSGVVADSYILTPTLSGYTFAPLTRTVTVPPNASGQDFVGTQQGCMINYLPALLRR